MSESQYSNYSLPAYIGGNKFSDMLPHIYTSTKGVCFMK